jgi:hypothetical protein
MMEISFGAKIRNIIDLMDQPLNTLMGINHTILKVSNTQKKSSIKRLTRCAEEFNKKTNPMCSKIVTIDGVEYELKEKPT